MKYAVGYGEGVQEFEIPETNSVAVLLPNAAETCPDGAGEAARALLNPIGSRRLKDIIKKGEKIAVITSDNTRPVPSGAVLPVLLAELEEAGVCDSDITIVVALGIHRPLSAGEIKKLVGADVYGKVKCENSTPGDCVRIGFTAYGTPVDISRSVAEADRRIALGNVEFHYFAGYSGGAKALMPGVSSREAIQANHSKMIMPEAAAGRLEGNPVRLDLDEVLNFCPLDFILNLVLDEHKQIIRAFAGHPILANREACRFLDGVYAVGFEKKADIVIASQGGAPKDLNLYQTQKALDNARHAVRGGGVIILCGACDEGLGEDVFEKWMTESPSPESMISRIKTDFELGGHKAAAIALVLRNADIYLVSDMEPGFVKSIFLQPFESVQSALDAALKKLGSGASVTVMPYAGSTLPKLL